MRLILASQRYKQVKGFKNPLLDVLRQAMPLATRVQAAVAYVSRPEHALLEQCLKLNKRLELWSRHDETLATSPDVMGRFLRERNPNFVCYLIGRYYHPKVIWWHGYGAYIGSANLTDSAWGGNIEAGVLIREDELDADDLRGELEAFFEDLRELGAQVTPEIYQDAIEHRNALGRFLQEKAKAGNAFRELKTFNALQNKSLSEITSSRDPRKRLVAFRQEWDATLQHLRDLQAVVAVPENRPDWVPPTAPAAIQVDQFLHAVYYTRVREGIAIPYERWYQRNHLDPKAAVAESVAWWRATKRENHGDELTILTGWVETQRRLLTPDKVGQLTESEFVASARCIHAINDHAKRRRTSELGEIELDDEEGSLEERRNRHCHSLFFERNAMDWSPPKLLEYLLFGGSWQETPDRLFKCVHDPDYKIPRLGLSALGEFVGWGLPDHFPPRNDRTNKALRALGYNVHVNSPNRSA